MLSAPRTRRQDITLACVHAGDWLRQMEMDWRARSCTLSEIFWESTLDVDRLIRTVGFQRAAAQSLNELELRTRNIVEACTDGVHTHRRSWGPAP
jgi:penicillin amidase